MCRACASAWKQEWREKRCAEAFAYVAKLKTQPCVDCKQSFHPAAMDFDHVRGTKKYRIAWMLNKPCLLEEIKKEIAKCELVCACCHRVRTYERSQQQRLDRVRKASY